MVRYLFCFVVYIIMEVTAVLVNSFGFVVSCGFPVYDILESQQDMQ